MKDFEKRLEEEIEKFAKKYKLQYEVVEAFAEYIAWKSMQEQKTRIIKIIG